jgi:hypothetical protein
MIAEKVPPGINRMGIAPDIKRMEGCMFAADQLLDNI